MGPVPLVTEKIEAALPLLAEFGNTYPVAVAFWMHESDASEWMLCVASSRINDNNFDLAYDEAGRITSEYPDPYFDPLRVRVLGAGERAAKDALALRARYGGKKPAWAFGPVAFGGVEVEGVYVYPARLPAPAPPAT